MRERAPGRCPGAGGAVWFRAAERGRRVRPRGRGPPGAEGQWKRHGRGPSRMGRPAPGRTGAAPSAVRSPVPHTAPSGGIADAVAFALGYICCARGVLPSPAPGSSGAVRAAPRRPGSPRGGPPPQCIRLATRRRAASLDRRERPPRLVLRRSRAMGERRGSPPETTNDVPAAARRSGFGAGPGDAGRRRVSRVGRPSAAPRRRRACRPAAAPPARSARRWSDA